MPTYRKEKLKNIKYLFVIYYEIAKRVQLNIYLFINWLKGNGLVVFIIHMIRVQISKSI